jgi:hypothetical protein
MTGVGEEFDFVIYRPPLSSQRIETMKAKAANFWSPSYSYQHSLKDVKNQMTPAEHFRYMLQTSGKEIRLIQRFELRYARNVELFERSAVKIQALFRGRKGREYFATVKDDLSLRFRQREAKNKSIKLFLEDCYDQVVFVSL